jgi:hypothetical protein
MLLLFSCAGSGRQKWLRQKMTTMAQFTRQIGEEGKGKNDEGKCEQRAID